MMELKYSSTILAILFHCSLSLAQTTTSTDGFNTSGNKVEEDKRSWLKRHDHFLFVLILSLLLAGILLWYITRSIRSMRQRLDEENQQNLMMIENTMGRKDMMETIPNDGFNKVPVYVPQQQQYTHRY
ncbi:unnamed protein product [Rhizopus stolonifer]